MSPGILVPNNSAKYLGCFLPITYKQLSLAELSQLWSEQSEQYQLEWLTDLSWFWSAFYGLAVRADFQHFGVRDLILHIFSMICRMEITHTQVPGNSLASLILKFGKDLCLYVKGVELRVRRANYGVSTFCSIEQFNRMLKFSLILINCKNYLTWIAINDF